MRGKGLQHDDSRKRRLRFDGLMVFGGALSLTGSSKPPYNRHQEAYYLSQDQIYFVRPGIVFKINQAQIAPDGTISATFQITDPQSLPLDLNGVATPGAVKVAMTLATIYNDGVSEQYTNHITKTVPDPARSNTGTQGTLDSGGTFRQVGAGLYTYTFKTKVPGCDPTATHSVGGQAVRDLTEFGLGILALGHHTTGLHHPHASRNRRLRTLSYQQEHRCARFVREYCRSTSEFRRG